MAHNIVNVPIAPMWREKELNQSTKPSQVNYGEGRNTRNKTKLKAAAAASASKDANANESENLINDDTVMGDLDLRKNDNVEDNFPKRHSVSSRHPPGILAHSLEFY